MPCKSPPACMPLLGLSLSKQAHTRAGDTRWTSRSSPVHSAMVSRATQLTILTRPRRPTSHISLSRACRRHSPRTIPFRVHRVPSRTDPSLWMKLLATSLASLAKTAGTPNGTRLAEVTRVNTQEVLRSVGVQARLWGKSPESFLDLSSRKLRWMVGIDQGHTAIMLMCHWQSSVNLRIDEHAG